MLLTNGIYQTVNCFVHPEDVVVLSLAAGGPVNNAGFQFQTQLRNEIKTDQVITLTSLQVVGNAAVAQWSNGTVLAIASKSSHDQISVNAAVISVVGTLPHSEILLAPATSQAQALSKIKSFQRESDLQSAAYRYWNSWMDAGKSPVFKSTEAESAKYLEAYKRNLYCVKSASLNGQIPADITGQFVTNGMPQLYPRDAMMCARVLLLTGHLTEAKQVIEFWGRPQIPMKTPGEW